MARTRLNIEAIDKSLQDVQEQFETINSSFTELRAPLTDEIRYNLVEGYEYVDMLLARKTDILDGRNVSELLELNARVLCGSGKKVRKENTAHIKATEKHFYSDYGGGIGSLMEWYQLHSNNTVWMRAAGTFFEVLSYPQLFIEGNHRTSALIVSYILGRSGKPPFVLTPENAKAFFDPSVLAKGTKKHGIQAIFKAPKIKKKFANLIHSSSAKRFLKQ